MGKSGKKGYFGKHSKSSAAMISLTIHAVLILVAVSFVAVRVYVKEEQVFEAKPVSRPTMKLKKLTVPVNVKKKKMQKPKLRKNIVAKPKTKSMDIKMPELNGLDATREIRTFNANIPIIAQTAYALLGDCEMAIEVGCNDYITKPIKRNLLLDIIKKYI
jgi:response regulator RpfG family c-di-GMP phosphodiesterase